MATFQGFEIISNFSGIFSFLFMFCIVYGFLSITKLFGEEKGKTLNPTIAISLAFIASFSSRLVNMISSMAPWLIIFMIALFFIMLFLRFLGVSDDTMDGFFASGGPKEKRTVIYWTIVVVLVIVILAISLEIGGEVGPYLGREGQSNISTTPKESLDGTTTETQKPESFADNLGATLFHPNVVGVILVLLFASIAIRQLSLEE